jgi:valyl-tRNA synthetase
LQILQRLIKIPDSQFSDTILAMDPQYDHAKYESDIYKLWEDSGAFTPTVKKGKKPFTIIMTPPNASDPLHIGHARFVAIQDVLIRYHRMKGEAALWLPGADHAGIETQFVFERKLKEKGKSRFDFDNETLYKMIWDDVENNKQTMEDQLRKLGASCDWTRNKFTLDPEIVKVVYKTFKKLYEDNLIYRGERIVNFCPRCGTAYSQLEVDYIERDDNIYYLDYGVVTIATTRPETIFADVAIAVNPNDKKFKDLIGKTAKIPLINREIPVIADNHVDQTFGTGALKVTPAHDAVDFEIGQAHKLPLISVIDEKGRMTGTPEKYIGMKAEVAREEVVKDLEATGLLKKTEKIHHTVGTCYRDHGNLEPMVSKQWFIKVEPLAKKALETIKNKGVVFASKKYEKIATHWLKNLRDWNISRQIVWGIRIPAYRCEKCLEWAITDGEAPTECAKCKNNKLTQDMDTFDTWFSSGQWPFATLKTTKSGDFEYFYPTSVMETAYDILPFWIIRMVMLGVYATGEVPFKEVLIHGLVRDKNGVKISKSKGNVINPIEMVDKYGADSLRMGLLWGALVENDVALSEENINAQRKFSNKIWNASRFVLEHLEESNKKGEKDAELKSNLKTIVRTATKRLDKMQLSQTAEWLYAWFWNDYCNRYLELSKKGLISKKAMIEALEVNLKLLHPFMPFVTEKVWELMKKDSLLITSSWPKA